MTKHISKTLIIGLGGTGQRVIWDIKKRLLRTYGEIPPLVRFLAFDTEDGWYDNKPFMYDYNGESCVTKQYNLQSNEFVRLDFRYIKPDRLSDNIPLLEKDSIFKNLNCQKLARTLSYFDMDRQGPPYHIISRFQGRAHLLNSSGKIISILKDTVNGLKGACLNAVEQARGYETEGCDISVYVIASLAGGTGSSAIMDISRMLQIAGVNVQYNFNNGCMDQIYGMFFLPRFFDLKLNYNRINAYTALSELDYTLELADPMRYPAGCPELAMDQNDYAGFTNNNKRVIYDGIYLIDALASKGHTQTFQEASAKVASFIAGSIAAGLGTRMSNYVNSMHKVHCVDGKYQNYSGMGYCEIRFCRQELVKYLLNRKLIANLENYRAGENAISARQVAEIFINKNNLNEGVMKDVQGEDTRAQLNDLTDAIINMTDGKLKGIIMSGVDTGRDAAVNIETSKARYLNAIGTAAQELVQAFARPKEELFKNLREMLDNRMAGKGFGTFPDLARCLKTMLADMKSGLEDEINQHAAAIERIENELRSTKTVIAENVPGLIFSGSKRETQEAAIRGYCYKIRFDMGNQRNPTLAWLKVETARKTEAVAIYEEMIGIVESYYKEETVETVNGIQIQVTGSYLSVDGLYRALMDQFLRAINGYQPRKAAVDETVFADAYFKEYFDSHETDAIALDDQSQYAFDEYIGDLFSELPTADDNLMDEMRKKLLGLLPADDMVRKIQEVRLSIDELFILCFGRYDSVGDKGDMEANPQLQMLGQLDTVFETLWCYEDFKGQGMPPYKNLVVGVYDTRNHIFNADNGYFDAICDCWDHRDFICVGNPDKISFMLVETAIPAFKLMGVDSWAQEYNQMKRFAYTFSDKRLEGIEMIKPGANEDAEIAWAYGWLFGLIYNSKEKGGLRVKPSKEYVSIKGVVLDSDGDYNYFETVNHRDDIFDCHRKFINDPDLSQDILNQAMEMLMADPLGNAIKILEWVNDGKMWDSSIRGKERSSMTQAEIYVIQDEVKFLELRFTRLVEYSLALDCTGRVTHIYSEALEQKMKEMKAKNAPEA